MPDIPACSGCSCSGTLAALRQFFVSVAAGVAGLAFAAGLSVPMAGAGPPSIPPVCQTDTTTQTQTTQTQTTTTSTTGTQTYDLPTGDAEQPDASYAPRAD